MCRRRREIECRVTPAEIPVFLGLDIGTQSLKAALFDNRFTIAGQGAEPLTYAFAPGGKAEQDPGDWLAALRPAIARALTMADCPAEAVRGIGAGGHLTGSRKMDHALASTTLLYDIEAGAYDPGLCAALGVGEDSLPETAGMEEPAGTLNRLGAELTGLPQGIPVAVGTGDDFSNAIGGALEWAVRLLNLDNVQTLTELAAIAPRDRMVFFPACLDRVNGTRLVNGYARVFFRIVGGAWCAPSGTGDRRRDGLCDARCADQADRTGA